MCRCPIFTREKKRLLFPFTTPSVKKRLKRSAERPLCENGVSECPQTLRYPEIINFSSAKNAQSSAEGI